MMDTIIKILAHLLLADLIEGLYFPLEASTLTLREDSPGPELVRLTALRYSGLPAGGAVYGTSHEASPSSLWLDPGGSLRWASSTAERRNVTVAVEARYMGYTAAAEIHLNVLPAERDPCRLTLQEKCFGGLEGNEYRVYAESRYPVTLLTLQAKSRCKSEEQPSYALHGGEGGVAALKDGRLTVSPALAGGEFLLTLTCAIGKDQQLTRKLKVNLIPSRLQLPLYPASVVRRLVPAIQQGSEVLLSWAVVRRGTPAHLESKNKTYSLKIESRNFTTDLLNATLLLVKLVWTRNTSETYIKVPIKISFCPGSSLAKLKDCKKGSTKCLEEYKTCSMEVWCEVTRTADLPRADYPGGRLRVVPSPYARLAQPSANTSSAAAAAADLGRLVFRPALPPLLDSPFNVTSSLGIVYLLPWSVQALRHTSLQPGCLVEWELEGRGGGGLSWLDIGVLQSDCKEWDVCSEAKTEKSCQRPCRIAATPLRKGSCEWRNVTTAAASSVMSRNYSTCSPQLAFCPDKVCDPLERLDPAICSQDCTRHDPTLGTLDEDQEGIQKGVGVCSCDTTGKCHCGKVLPDAVKGAGKRREENSELNKMVEQPLPPPKLTAAQVEKQTCDGQCIALIGLIAVAGTITVVSIVYVSASRSCLIRQKCQENPGEYSGHALLPIGPSEIRSTTPIRDTRPIQLEIDPKWEVPRSLLKVEECLGEGEFGRVLKAVARDLPNHQGFITVAVKTLKDNAGNSELEDLISEYQLLKEVSHPNVVRLLGACTGVGGPLYIIIEYCALGSLRAYLRRYRNIKPKDDSACLQENDKITPHDVLSFAWQISKGMAYLTEIKLVHRDLAARNILLATGKVCKISDFGLTRDVYEDDTYLKKSRGRVPVKWMALESLSDHIYTSKSDVWSFGVVLWELVTLGSSPYPGVAVQNLYHLLKNGYRMQRPNNCTIQLYEIMKECWSANPSDRPSFATLVDKFERMLEDGSDYLDCNLVMVTNPSYFTDIPTKGPPGENEMDIQFKMDLRDEDDDEPETDLARYENDSVNKNTTYDFPKPISSILMSDLLTKEEQR